MRRFYALVKLTYGEPASPAKAAELEVDWWRMHREQQATYGTSTVPDSLATSISQVSVHLRQRPGRQPRQSPARARALPSGFNRADITPATLSHLPSAVHAAVVAGYAASIQTVFLTAVPIAALAFRPPG
jgi:hypothetical protein